MPIWLRKFTFNNIQNYFDEVNEINEKKSANTPNTKELFGPDISPSYSTKASK